MGNSGAVPVPWHRRLRRTTERAERTDKVRRVNPRRMQRRRSLRIPRRRGRKTHYYPLRRS